MTRAELSREIAVSLRSRGYIVIGDSPMVVVGPSKVAFLEPTATNRPILDVPNFQGLRDHGYPASRVRTVEEANEVMSRAPHRLVQR